jgi:hypothetical protein
MTEITATSHPREVASEAEGGHFPPPQAPPPPSIRRRVPALERRYPPGCPDPDWCGGNNVCYWDCLRGPYDDLDESDG